MFVCFGQICVAVRGGLNYVEWLLQKQIVAAIGKVVCPGDFDQYMRFHMRKFYLPTFQPLPFSYAVRRPGYTPEGTLSIETRGVSSADPIFTLRSESKAQPTSFSLDASTRINFNGPRFVHGWFNQEFAQSSQSYQLVRTSLHPLPWLIRLDL